MNSTVKPENDIAGTATQRPLLSRDFVLLVAGQGISLFGNVMLRFAMSMWVLDETGSATIFASVLAISIVPTILLSPFGGVLADRVNRRTIMVALDAISAVLVLASAIVFATTGFHIVAIATMQVLLAVLGAFETPTVQAALPQMFRQYGPATMRQGMAVINQVQQLSSLLPSFLGGVLYAMFGIRLMMIIAIASFAGAAALECFIRLSAPDRGDEECPPHLKTSRQACDSSSRTGRTCSDCCCSRRRSTLCLSAIPASASRTRFVQCSASTPLSTASPTA